MNKVKFDKFCNTYHACLELAVKTTPEEYYWYPTTPISVIAARMCRAVEVGSFNKDSKGFRLTCKVLNIKHTYKAIDEYLER